MEEKVSNYYANSKVRRLPELREIAERIARRRTAEKIVKEILSLAIEGVGKNALSTKPT